MSETPASVDAYIATFPPDVQTRLSDLRATLHAAAPGSGETIRYQIPAITVDGSYLIHFAGWKHHIGLYPVPVFDGPLEDEVGPWRSSKDTVKLPYSKPIPHDLVTRVTRTILAQRGGAGLPEGRRG